MGVKISFEFQDHLWPHCEYWFGREKQHVAEWPAKRQLWKCWREVTGSGGRWHWCRRVEPDGAKRQNPLRGGAMRERELRVCWVVGLDGWGDGQHGEWVRFSTKTMSSISDMWSLRLLVHQPLSDFLFPEMAFLPQFLMGNSSSSTKAQLRHYCLPSPRHQAVFIISSPVLSLSPGNCNTLFTSRVLC